MKVTYELSDKDSNQIMILYGKEYITPIGFNVLFKDFENNIQNNGLFFELIGKVISHTYCVNTDTLYVNCEIIKDLSEEDMLDYLNFYGIKHNEL